MTLRNSESCSMESRIVKLETEHKILKDTMDSYSDALNRNTESLQELTKIMIRHDEILQNEQRDNATRNALITGVATGIIVFLATGVMHLV